MWSVPSFILIMHQFLHSSSFFSSYSYFLVILGSVLILTVEQISIYVATITLLTLLLLLLGLLYLREKCKPFNFVLVSPARSLIFHIRLKVYCTRLECVHVSMLLVIFARGHEDRWGMMLEQRREVVSFKLVTLEIKPRPHVQELAEEE